MWGLYKRGGLLCVVPKCGVVVKRWFVPKTCTKGGLLIGEVVSVGLYKWGVL